MSFPLPALSPERKILKVQELTSRIRTEVERAFSDLWVEGEVANLKIPTSGHLYFTLKDEIAQIRAIIFRSHGRFLKFSPREGQSVLIRGHLTLYEAKGEYQLIVDYIEPKGAGALQAAFEALKEKLRREGLFGTDRKRPIPNLPRRMGLITSPTGAALRDILKVIWGKGLPFHLQINPVAVQGEGAADEIAHAIFEMNQMSEQSPSQQIDLLILARGGGSLEDLWAFNEEIVARAIAQSKIPIISAVGHETDTTIADFVADHRAPTPSIAAELIVRNGMALLERFAFLQKALHDQIRGQIEERRNRLRHEARLLIAPARQIGHFLDQADHLTIRLRQAVVRLQEARREKWTRCHQSLAHLNPVERLRQVRQRLQRLSMHLIEEGEGLIVQRRSLLQLKMVQLNLLSPLNILGRGYSIVRNPLSLEVIRDIDQVGLKDRLQITLSRGEIICSVEEKKPPRQDQQRPCL